jgi:hypothetical protein
MLVRIRWFFLGALLSLGGGAWLIGRAVRWRERLTPANLTRLAGHTAADWIDRAGAAIGGVSR